VSVGIVEVLLGRFFELSNVIPLNGLTLLVVITVLSINCTDLALLGC
jgi:hypothetical protein